MTCAIIISGAFLSVALAASARVFPNRLEEHPLYSYDDVSSETSVSKDSSNAFLRFIASASVGYLPGKHRRYYFVFPRRGYIEHWAKGACTFSTSSAQVHLNESGPLPWTHDDTRLTLYFQCLAPQVCCDNDCCDRDSLLSKNSNYNYAALQGLVAVLVILVIITCCLAICSRLLRTFGGLDNLLAVIPFVGYKRMQNSVNSSMMRSSCAVYQRNGAGGGGKANVLCSQSSSLNASTELAADRKHYHNSRELLNDMQTLMQSSMAGSIGRQTAV